MIDALQLQHREPPAYQTSSFFLAKPGFYHFEIWTSVEYHSSLVAPSRQSKSDLDINHSWEGSDQLCKDCLEVVPRATPTPVVGYQQSSSVVSGYKTWISSAGKTQQKLPGLHPIGRSQQERPGPAEMPGEVIWHASLNEVKTKNETDKTLQS